MHVHVQDSMPTNIMTNLRKSNTMFYQIKLPNPFSRTRGSWNPWHNV